MGSIIAGFEYDIFVSYRHKDNRYDGWVTDFIEDLKSEIEATIKDDITIYHDENPVDGLLESHLVDQSLSRKLNACILIPVLSRTYCDPRSFAWNYEFMAFNRLSKQDLYGRDITLRDGNVSSRILPVKIHEIERDDHILLEKTLGGHPRAIDFMYHSPGVNRPLRRKDDDMIRSESQVIYRDQINKLALSIKAILAGMRGMDVEVDYGEKRTAESQHETKGSSTTFRKKILKQVHLFSRLSSDQLSEISDRLDMITVEHDQLIIQKGEPGESMFIIVDGSVKVHDNEHVFTHLGGGDCFGEYTLIDEIERSASVTSIETTTLFKLEKDAFQDIVSENPQFLQAMLRVLTDRLRRLDATQEKLAASHSKAVAEHKDLESRTNELQGKLDIKQQMLKIVALDLQNPLTSSLSITELLKEEVKSDKPELLEHLEGITRSLQKMNDITLKLVELEKTENQTVK